MRWLDFTFSKTCKPEADVKIALNIYLFLNWANVFLKYTAVLFAACKKNEPEAVMQFALNTHFFPNTLTLFLIVSGAVGSFGKSENCRKLLFAFETGNRIFMYMTTDVSVCDLLEPRGM
jgi:hypothetical protein